MASSARSMYESRSSINESGASILNLIEYKLIVPKSCRAHHYWNRITGGSGPLCRFSISGKTQTVPVSVRFGLIATSLIPDHADPELMARE